LSTVYTPKERGNMVTDCDVAVVGYGPVGMVTAALLGQLGHRVVVLERHPGLYNLPRAATFDDETMRTFAQLGIAEELLPGLRVQQTYQWCNGDGEVLLEQHFDLAGASGWAEWYMMYQPELEDALDAVCRGLGSVDVRPSCTVTGLTQTVDGARVEYRHGPATEMLTARYVVGCDGGNSFVRECLGVGEFDFGFAEPWMVCDFRLSGGVEPPAARQLGDPKAPTSIISIGLRHHRFSFMLDSPDDFTAASEPELVWQRVASYLTPDDAELIRVATYTFRSLVADRWRVGNVLLAGDAAHQMPPFLGQGMCSGVRDARNLAFKLDLVLRGAASPAVLDTYQSEREPHVRTVIAAGVRLGQQHTLRDAGAAAERDRVMRAQRDSGGPPARVRLPDLGPGLLSDGYPLGAGRLSVQGAVAHDGGRGLLDAVIGNGFCLLAETQAARTLAAAGLGRQLQEAGVHVVELVPGGDIDGSPVAGVRVTDADGTYRRWFSELGATAVVVRPDFYVYGAVADPANAPGLGRELLSAVLGVPQPEPAP
jgi:2-polyprenyl-6-methoxyphenol hydroxylase-like FAD-dependent oxidoreductase